MAELKDLSLLAIHESIEEISRISSVLDNSGFRVRSYKAETEDELQEQLRDTNIDIIIAQAEHSDLTAKAVIQTLQRLGKDIPVLILMPKLSGIEAANYIRMGARDLIANDEDQHMAAVVTRELESRDARNSHRSALRKLSAAEHRYQRSLQYSRLPTAIVQESMFSW